MNISWDIWLGMINSCIGNKVQPKFSGLVDGKCGLILLYSQLYSLSNNTFYLDKLYKEIDIIMDTIPDNYSLGYGVAGIAWTINCIKDTQVFHETNDWFSEVDPLLETEYFKNIREGNIDYFEGAMGILFYFLDKGDYPIGKMKDLITEFCNYISTLQNKESWVQLKYNRKENIFYNSINLGVPHGITGVLLILLLIKEKTAIDIDPLIEKIINLILSFEILDNYFCHFPLTYEKAEINGQIFSTIGWCYGDLMISYAIYKAGILLGKTDYSEYGIRILTETTYRINHYKEKLVLCHGFTSLSYIYNQIYYRTQNEIFKNRSLYWNNEAIDLFLLRYKRHKKGMKDDFFEDASLFMGYPGYFLSLISWGNNNMDNWTSCLLL